MRVKLEDIIKALTILERVDALLYGDKMEILQRELTAAERVTLALDARWAARDLMRQVGKEMLEVVKSTDGTELVL